MLSPDGYWRWDGGRWVLNVPPPPPPAPSWVRTSLMRARRIAAWVLLGTVGLDLLWFIAAVVVAVAQEVPTENMPTGLEIPFAFLLVLTPLALLAWLGLFIACRVERRRRRAA